MYAQNVNSVNVAGHNIFLNKYKPKGENIPLENIKSIDESLMPPCNSVLIQHINLANYISELWKNSDKAKMIPLIPEEQGWTLDQNHC